jgi:hypothetical protein
LAAVLLAPVALRAPVSAGALEPHPLIKAAVVIRARAANGRGRLFMCSPAG